MTDKTTEALKLAEALENDAKEHREVSYGLDCPPERTANWKHALNCEAAARLIRELLAEPVKQEHKCSDHPDAPHGFDRNASHSADRYVCECEGWEPPMQEPVAWMNKVANVFAQHPEGAKNFGCDIALYAAPVGAEHFLKAIAALREGIATCRAEALEEAAKRVYDSTDWAHDERDIELKEVIAAAIRGLK